MINLMGSHGGLFACMEIAGQLCKSPDVNGAFKFMCPTNGMADLSPKVYRAHAEELIRRFRARQDLRPATDVEIMLGLMRTSLVAPLRSEGTALYEHLFIKCFGALPEGQTPMGRELYEGQLVDDMAQHRHALRDETRRHTYGPE